MEGGEAPARGSAPGDDAATGFALAGAPARQRRKTALLVTDEDAAPQIKRQAVLGVNAGGLHVAEDAAPAPAPRIIPAQPDTFRSGRRPTFVPDATPDPALSVSAGLARFASDETSKLGPGGDSSSGYGLQVRGRRKEEQRDARGGREEGGVGGRDGGGGGSDEDRRDGSRSGRGCRDASPPADPRLPPAASPAAYAEMPIEGFGRALFAGMGWVEGQAMGRRKGTDVVAKVPNRRPALLGLGASEAKPIPGAAAARGLAGADRGGAGGARTNSREASRGDGADKGSSGRAEATGARPASRDGGRDDRRPASRDGGRDDRRPASRDGGRDDRRPASRDGGRDDRRSSSRFSREPSHPPSDMRSSLSSRGHSSVSPSPPPVRRPVLPSRSWLAPGIRVRVVSGPLAGTSRCSSGALPKATVLDVPRLGVGTLRLDPEEDAEGRRAPHARARHVTAHQDDLETVIPRREGARVGVVGGRHKGQAGSLLQRDVRTGLAHVLLDGEGEVERLSLDHVAQLDDEGAFLGRNG